MDDQLAGLDRGVEDLRQELTAFRLDAIARVGRSFKWTMATMAVGVLAMWFGIFLYLARGAEQLRQLLRAL